MPEKVIKIGGVMGLMVAVWVTIPACGQQRSKGLDNTSLLQPGDKLTLTDCHRLTLQDNKALKSSEEQRRAAAALEKMAVAEFFPRVSANGIYHWQDRNIQLLSDEQQSSLQNCGTTAVNSLLNGSSLYQMLESMLSAGGQEALHSLMQQALSGVSGGLNAAGADIVEALNIDMTNLTAGAVTVSQPIYMGGKLRAMHRAAAMACNISEINYDKLQQDKLIETDKAYWQVISVRHQKELAEQYCRLVEHLDSNMQELVNVEMATAADAAKVRVKLNEAQMMKTKASGGYVLAKMLLFQTVGLDIDGDYEVVEDTVIVSYAAYDSIDMEAVLQHRDELKLLVCADTLAQAGVMAARSGLLPNILMEGSYVTTKPNFFNGVQNNFGGTFAVGVVVNIPIAHPAAFYGYKAARHQAMSQRYRHEEAEEMVRLQVNKLNTDLAVANKKYAQAQTHVRCAEENLALASESFAAGVVSSTELMAAQTAWLQAKSELLDAEIEIKMTYIYLQQAMGKRREM